MPEPAANRTVGATLPPEGPRDPDVVTYLQAQCVAAMLDEALQRLVTERPANARLWLAQYIASGGDAYPPHNIALCVQGHPDWVKSGCGNGEYSFADAAGRGNAYGLPSELPAVSGSNSLVLKLFKKNQELYQRNREKVTKAGVTLAKCIKPSLDHADLDNFDQCGKQHPCGVYAGDVDCFDTFREVFDLVTRYRHGPVKPLDVHPHDCSVADVPPGPLDPGGKYVQACWIRISRTVQGFRLPPSIGFDERRQLEDTVVHALMAIFPQSACGARPDCGYFPLYGSRSPSQNPAVPLGLSQAAEAAIRKRSTGVPFPRCLASKSLLSSGTSRHWPDARGVWREDYGDGSELFVWVNEEDHIRMIVSAGGGLLRPALQRIAEVEQLLRNQLEASGSGFVERGKFGWVTADPSNLGTCLQVRCSMRLADLFGNGTASSGTAPPLSSQSDLAQDLCRKLGVTVAPMPQNPMSNPYQRQRQVAREAQHNKSGGAAQLKPDEGLWFLTSADIMHKTEADIVRNFHEAITELCRLETLLEAGETQKVIEVLAQRSQATQLCEPGLQGTFRGGAVGGASQPQPQSGLDAG